LAAAAAPKSGAAYQAAAPAAALIEFSGIAKSFTTADGSELEVIRDIDLTIHRGEFLTLVGPSGCGKSTLLNLTAGLLTPSRGTVLYAGQLVRGINTSVGYMTQNDHLLPWRNIAANIEVPLEIKGLSRAQRRERVAELIALVGLSGFEKAYPTQVSGGMRKRTALARLLAYNPETLLMDEPFGALDAQLRLTLQAELLAICAKLRKTILFVTHDLDEAISLADRCIVFSARPGTIVDVVETGLPKDRSLVDLRFDRRFLDLAQNLWALLTPALGQSGRVK